MRRGLTLAELMIAAFIIVFSVSAILLLFMNCIFMNTASRNVTLATSHAQYVLEEIRNTTPFTNIYSLILAGGINGWDWDAATIEQRGLAVLDNELITTTAPDGDVNPLNVRVTLTWMDDGVRQRSIALDTLIANY